MSENAALLGTADGRTCDGLEEEMGSEGQSQIAWIEFRSSFTCLQDPE